MTSPSANDRRGFAPGASGVGHGHPGTRCAGRAATPGTRVARLRLAGALRHLAGDKHRATLFDTDRAKVLEALDYALSLTHAGPTEIRALIFELRPESLEMEGLVAALTKQIAAASVRHGIEIELTCAMNPMCGSRSKNRCTESPRSTEQHGQTAQRERLDVRLSTSRTSSAWRCATTASALIRWPATRVTWDCARCASGRR